MGQYHHLYMNNPTAGETDGTRISEDRTFTAPLSVVLDASKNESKIVKCAVRCEEGYETVGNTTIKPVYYDGSAYQEAGGNISKWKLAPDLSTPGSNTYTITANAASGDTVSVGDVTVTAGTDFEVGSDVASTATNIATAITEKSVLYTATSSGAVVTVKEKAAGGGNAPGTAVVTGTIGITSGTAVVSAPADSEYMEKNGVWGDTLTVADVVGSKNVIFWVKASATDDEKPVKDTTTALHSEVTVQATE